MKRVASRLLAVVLTLGGVGIVQPGAAPAAANCARPATSAAAMNTVTVPGIDFTDSFRTAKLPDGRWMSVTGDTQITGSEYPTSNSVIIWDRAGTHRTAPHGNFFPSWEDGSGFWPGQWVSVNGAVFVIGSRQKLNEDGSFGWTSKGAYVAVVDVPFCGTPRFVTYLDTPSSGLGDEHVQWSGGLTAHAGWFYIHGVLDRPDAYHSRDGGYVARARALNGAWEFWTGAGWSPDPAAAIPTIPVIPGGGGTEAAYTVDVLKGKWTVVTKWGALTTLTGAYTSATPVGPWVWTTWLETCVFNCYLAGAVRIPTVSGKQMIQWSRTGEMPVWAEVTL